MTSRHPNRSPSASAIFCSAFFCCVVIAGMLAGAPTARAAEQGVVVDDPWMRFIMPARPAAGYFTLSNKTSRPRTLVSAASPACGMLMLHRSLSDSGVERMAMVKGVDVPAHGDVVFAPGGYHLMCMSPSGAMVPGHSVPVTLRFKNGDQMTVSFSVRGVAGK